MITAKCAEMTKRNFWNPICHSAIGEASFLAWARHRHCHIGFAKSADHYLCVVSDTVDSEKQIRVL